METLDRMACLLAQPAMDIHTYTILYIRELQ